tara:strand:+ start:1002 stop:1601 length:600 start_codon:yes stop_codon:yes gene_type:complete
MRKYSSNLAFVDLLFNLLVGFTSLFVIAFLMINPIAKTGEVTPPIRMFVEVEWDSSLNIDIDLFVRGPDGSIVFFGRKDGGYMTLERDDLGWQSDIYHINGEARLVRRNYEIINFADLPEGEYVIAVFYFTSRGDPVEVTARIRTISPHRVVYEGTTVDLTPRQERTVVSFTVDKDGKVEDLNTELQIPITGRGASLTP